MNGSPPPEPAKQHGPIPWWMPNEPNPKRIGVFIAVCLSAILGATVGLLAMHRLQRWLRRRRDGGSVNAEPTAGDRSGVDPKNSDRGNLGAPRRGRQPAAPLAAGYPTWPGGDRPAGPYSVAAGAGVLPGAETTYRGSGLASPLPAAPTGPLTDRGPDRDPDVRSGRREGQAAIATAGTAAATPAAAARHEPQERSSSRCSRHESSRSFPAGDCLAGLGGVDKETGELNPSKLSGGMDLSSRAAWESHRGGGGGGAALGATARGSLTASPGAATGDTVEALAAASRVELSPAPATQAVPALRSAPAPPPRLCGGMHEFATPPQTTRALFEPSYQEREVEQRLRQVVFGSFQQRASTSRPDLLGSTLLESYSSCGGLDSRRCGGGVSPSPELARLQPPAGPTAAAEAWGAGGGTGPPSVRGSGVGPGRPDLVSPPASHWGVALAQSPGGQQYGGAGSGGVIAGGVAALSARDLLLGRTASIGMPYHYAQALYCQAVAAAGPAGGGLPAAAQPTLMAAASVPAPPTPPLDGPYTRLTGLHVVCDRAPVAQPPGAPLQWVEKDAAAATSTSTQLQAEPLMPQPVPEQQAEIGALTGAASGTEPEPGLASGSGCRSEPGSGLDSSSDDEADESDSDRQRSETASSQSQAVAPLLQDAAEGAVAEAVRDMPDPASLLPSTFSFCVLPTAVENTGENGGAGIFATVKAASRSATALGNAADAATAAPVAALGSTGAAAAAMAAAAAATSPADRVGDTAAVALEARSGSSCAAQAGSRTDRSASDDDGVLQSTLDAVLACLAGDGPLLQGVAQDAPTTAVQQQRQLQPQQPKPQHSPLLWRFPQFQVPKASPQPQQRGGSAPSAPQALSGAPAPANAVENLGVEPSFQQDESDAVGARVPSAQALAGTLPSGLATAEATRIEGQRPKGGAGVVATGVAAVLAGQGSGLGWPEDVGGDVEGDGEAAPSPREAALLRPGAGSGEVVAERGLALYLEGHITGVGMPPQAALMAPRVWPASGAAGPEGPLARCVAERLMTRNPLFKRHGGSGTPDGVDSGIEDEGLDEE
ncbi:hypothetical protein PLESTB_000208400 [Pleodorina starrii]|uniref:Uncharacterized protein n=1 Tax=Pleodorina starrii TaxID=330485 RepID=A0A9W6BC68_9CHLO|nr:hypothetical protein PLESTM_000323300 [Pleodorina starrii]GLC49338.1 hypothetical protein PLESTB_000208400 [Pleodorina starrii]GLC73404.1 hypothetical protein PLESTF_001371700 [Pleodorina starrii]